MRRTAGRARPRTARPGVLRRRPRWRAGRRPRSRTPPQGSCPPWPRCAGVARTGAPPRWPPGCPSRAPGARRSRGRRYAPRPAGEPDRSSPLWTTADQFDGAWVAAWLALMATWWQRDAASTSRDPGTSTRPWNVATTGRRAWWPSARPAQSTWLCRMSSPSMPSMTAIRLTLSHGMAWMPAAPESRTGDGTVLTRRPGTSGVAGGEHGHVVASPVELDRERVNDALRAPVRHGRHPFEGRGDEADAQQLGGHRDPRGQSAARRMTTRRIGSSPMDWVDTPAHIAQGEVDPAPLERGHRLQLEHHAALDDLVRGSSRDLAQLALAPTAVVLDVHEHAGPGAHAPGQHQVDQVLQRRQALALAADERAEGLPLFVVHAADIDLGGVSGADGHARASVRRATPARRTRRRQTPAGGPGPARSRA